MTRTDSPATELRESIMALTRQLRRHRSDNGLTLSQQQVLGEVSRTGVTTPAELGHPHARAGAVADRRHQRTGARGLVARRTDDDDRRRQLIEITDRRARRCSRPTAPSATPGSTPRCATTLTDSSSTC